jgi:hypothetical protein
VALAAIGRETPGAMIRSSGFRKFLAVTAEALSRKSESIELPNGPHLVAGIAIRDCVRANERESILVLVDVMDGNLPTIAVVAQLAFRTVFASMQIGVAILALVGSICEFEIGMAVAACHSRVSSAKRKTGARMIEFDLSLDHLPIRGGVAGGARHIELPVWTLRGRKRPYRFPMRGASTQEKKHREKE